MPTSILFDLDGVLVDAKPLQFVCLQEALLEHSGVHVDKVIELTHDVPTREKLAWLADRGKIKHEDIEEIYELKRVVAERHFLKLPYDPDKVTLFNMLETMGIPFAVVTNSNRRSAKILLKTVGLWPFLSEDRLISNLDVINPKPHPEPFIRGMLALGGKFEDFVIFEDSTVGLEAAYATGVQVVEVKSVKDVNMKTVRSVINGRV